MATAPKPPKTPKKVSARQRRKSIQRSQVKFRKDTLEVKRAVSRRGRRHAMEQAAIGQPQTAQDVLMESTAIRRFKYYIGEKRLRIWFVSKHVYDYYNVPESVVLDLSEASSKGRYFYYNIRTSYKFRRVR